MPRILIADDHSVVRRRVREILETEAGFAVCAEAATGLEAVRLTAAELPDIVILDLSMPQLSGLEAARQIHQRFPQIQMLILTMYDLRELMDEATASGVGTCLFKTELHRLVATVSSIWQQRQRSNCSFSSGGAPERRCASTGVDVVEHPPPNALTEFEQQIVQMLARARTNKEIAATLSLTLQAVELHRAGIMRKLGINTIFDLVHYAMREKLVAPSRR